jgi:hypothetical protein
VAYVTDWLPRTPTEALIKTDTILAATVPTISLARVRIIDLAPGHSGRPAGNGEPGGGSGASTSTVVERTLGIVGEDKKSHGITLKRPTELRDLDRIDALTIRTVDLAEALAALTWTITPPPDGGSHARQLTWARWLIRRVTNGGLIDKRLIGHLYDDSNDLHHLVHQWATPAHTAGKRTLELAADPTEQWCRSCLRAGHRNQRDQRYARHGLCRWCGDFRAEQGQLPTLDIIDAHETGSAIAVARLIRDSKPRKKRRK